MESPLKENIEVSDDMKKKRAEREKKDKENVIEHAQMVLRRDKLAKGRRSKKMKVKSDEREFLQKTFEGEVEKKGKGKRFPGNLSSI